MVMAFENSTGYLFNQLLYKTQCDHTKMKYSHGLKCMKVSMKKGRDDVVIT